MSKLHFHERIIYVLIDTQHRLDFYIPLFLVRDCCETRVIKTVVCIVYTMHVMYSFVPIELVVIAVDFL